MKRRGAGDGTETTVEQALMRGFRYFSAGARGMAWFMLPAFGLTRIEFAFIGFDTLASGNAPGALDLSL